MQQEYRTEALDFESCIALKLPFFFGKCMSGRTMGVDVAFSLRSNIVLQLGSWAMPSATSHLGTSCFVRSIESRALPNTCAVCMSLVLYI